jgi:DNA-3-methyladenine glycosylase
MHDMLNVVCAPENDAQAVLLRGAQPVAGLAPDARLDGPGRLARGLEVTVASDNGTDLVGGRIWIEQGPAPAAITRTPRIGVEYAGEWATAPLRFVASS